MGLPSEAPPRSGLLVDSYGRRIKSLRVSITDKCNLRCAYCMPAEGLAWLPRAEILTYEAITRLVRIAVEIGIEQVRLTADGQLRTCLFAQEETDLRAVLRSRKSDAEIAQAIRHAVWHKELKHYIGDTRFRRSKRSISMIGG